MGPIVGLRELISMLVRRAPLIAAVLVAGIVATLTYATSLPRTYQAIEVIQLQPSAMQGAATGGQLSDAPARLRLIEQRVMTRQNVIDMIGTSSIERALTRGGETLGGMRSALAASF